MPLYKPQLFSSKIIIIMMGTRTDIHSSNEVEDSFVEDIQSTTYIKLYPLNTDFLLRHSETESYSIPLNAINSTLLGRVQGLITSAA
jgi:hypothetical protein